MDHSRITDYNWDKIKDLSPHDAVVMSVRETPSGIQVELLYPSKRPPLEPNTRLPWGPQD